MENMQLEVGAVLEGKVTGITKFGAFVELPGGETGMVHISEVALTYVREITDHLQENQIVKVMVMKIGEDGKIALSIKKTISPSEETSGQGNRNPSGNRYPPGNRNPSGNRNPTGNRPPARNDFGRRPRSNNDGPLSFEDMMSKFKQTSDEKISSLKRGNEPGRRGGSRRSKPDYDDSE